MILIIYILICIMYGSSNTALQNDYFGGGSRLTDVQIPEVALGEEPNRQRRFDSDSNYNSMSAKLFSEIDKGKNFIYSKVARNIRDKNYLPKNIEKNKINSGNKKSRSKNARRNSKTSSRGDTEDMINLFNKSGLPLEYLKKTFEIAVDSKENSPDLFRTKNLEKWRKKNLSHRTRIKNNGGNSLKKSSRNFLKRPNKNSNRFIRKSKKRSIDLQSKKSALPLNSKLFQSNSNCQPLESLKLFQNIKFGKLLDANSFKKCLLLRKTNKVELVIKNEGNATKFLGDALHGDLFSVFKVMDRISGTAFYESEVPEENINPSDKIQTPFKSLEDSHFYNEGTKEDNFLPIDSNKLQMLENAENEARPSSNDKDVSDMYMFPNNIAGENNLGNEYLEMENKINGNIPMDQIWDFPTDQNPMQSFNENLPSLNPVKPPNDNEHQNYVQIESKEIQSKITIPINDTATKELLDAAIKHIEPPQISQVENPFAANSSKYLISPEKQMLQNGINYTPVSAAAGFSRTRFPTMEEEQVFKEIINTLYSPSNTSTSTTTEHFVSKNKEIEIGNVFSAGKTFGSSPPPIQTNSGKLELLETSTKIAQTQAGTSLSFSVIPGDIHFIITEPFVTQTVPEIVTHNVLNENTESDYNVNNPHVNLNPEEEPPEKDIKMLKMHYRHPHGTKEPEIRHRRQYFHH